MQEKKLFEYAVIRIVPKVEREEFLNIGVILYCAKEKFLGVQYILDEKRLSSFCGAMGMPQLEGYLDAFERIAQGAADSGPIGKLPVAERFRWLTATRSTVLQTSRLHPGLCDDAAEMLAILFKKLVLTDKEDDKKNAG
ncbi:MAG: DUF3037 domain-containing protein [Ferruginibacter sp.]